MDLNRAPAASANSQENRPAAISARLLWQVPVFFLGVVAVVTACLTRGMVGPDPVRQLHHDLSEARRLLHRHTGDPDGALQHAQHALDSIMYDSGREPEAYFLLGSAHVRVAETAGEMDGGDHWREARKCLEEADRRGVAGDEAARLHYRLAKVCSHTGDDPKHVIALLKANKDQADDRAEALGLLSQAYLRLNPPNLKDALAANEELRQKVPQVGEDVLGPAKLAGAKLLLRLARTEEARKTLEKINEQAPATVRNEAHTLLAGLYQEERKWSEAAERLNAALADKRVPLTDPGSVLYNLGVCYQQLDQLTKASEAWSECVRRGHGEEAQAAALALAELRLQEANSDKAVEMLKEAVAKVRKADDWKNRLMDLPHVRDLFEKAVQTYRQANRFDLAVKSAELYERVAVAPKAQILRADLSRQWARWQRGQSKLAKDPATRKKDENFANELFLQAADAHAEAAKLLTVPAEKAEHIWLSAVASHEGRDYSRAAEKLTKILETEGDNADRESEGWFLLGEAHRHLKHPTEAQTAYKNCVANHAKFTCAARYQLATIDIEAGQIDQAAQNLEQNLKLEHPDPDPVAQEKSRFALCSLLYRGGSKLAKNYRQVVLLLEGNLDRTTVTPESVRARFQLADSYRQLGSQRMVNRLASEQMSPEASDHYLMENRRLLGRAADEFAKLEEIVKDEELSQLLTIKQRKEVPFIVADCRFNLGEYEKSLQKYDELAKKFSNGPETLWALRGAALCCGSMRDFEKFRQRAEQIRALLATTNLLTDAEKPSWIDWLDRASKEPPQPKERDTNREQPRNLNGPNTLLTPERP